MEDLVLQSPRNPHFFQPVLPGFENFLNIPVKFFSIHIEGRYEGQTVELRSDASDKSWKVKIEGRRLTIGWKEFVTAHDFRIGDVSIFRQQRPLLFHVTNFGLSFCEIQYAQESCNDEEDSLDNDEDNLKKLPRMNNVKAEADAEESFSSDQSCFVAHVTNSNLHEDTLFLPRKFVQFECLKKGTNRIVLVNEVAKTWTLNLRYRESTRTFYMRLGWRSFCNENGLKLGDCVTLKLESNNTPTPLLRFSTAKSMNVFTEDKSKCKRQKTGVNLQRVSSSSSSEHENRFLTLTVTPASFSYGRLNIPMNFITANGLGNAKRKKITLLDKHGEEWPVNLQMETNKNVIRLGTGLKEFFQANDIKVYESFVLELVWEEKTSCPMFKFCSKTNT